jgi:SOS-response transcriptional repressor LexA
MPVIEQNAGEVFIRKVTAQRWADILAAIMEFQQRNNGQSPSTPSIAARARLSPAVVTTELKAMEEHGLIRDYNGWPRRIEVNSVTKLTEAVESMVRSQRKRTAKVAESETVTGHTAKRRENLLTGARRFAQALTEYYDKHGQAPMLKDLAPILGYSGSSSLSRLAMVMTRKGWLHHTPGHQRDIALTGLGRAVLFGEVREDIHTDMPVRAAANGNAKPPTVTLPMPWLTAPHGSMVSVTSPDRNQDKEEYHADSPRAQPMTKPDLTDAEDVDLVIELMKRGFKVSR